MMGRNQNTSYLDNKQKDDLKRLKHLQSISSEIFTDKNLGDFENYTISKYKTNDILFNANIKALASAYIDFYNEDNDIILATYDGIFASGKLNDISRAEAKSLIEGNSGTTVSSVSKKLNYLIVGDKPTKKKIETAKELKITIINQSQFLKMLNKAS